MNAGTTSTASGGSMYETIQAWSVDHLTDRRLPAAAELEQIERALGATREFLLDPVASTLRTISADFRQEARRLPEAERPIGFEQLGRMMVWADDVRRSLRYLADSAAEIVLLLHEDMAELAGGYCPDGSSTEPGEYRNSLERLYGLAAR